ncbi:MAG: hypothetical protein IJ766_06220 [Clostridia bacterium]|nr:hypothetical protein [Clostridia bacterium]
MGIPTNLRKRVVGALKKYAGGIFLVPTEAAMPRGLFSGNPHMPRRTNLQKRVAQHTARRSGPLSHCSLGALRNALCPFLQIHRLSRPPDTAAHLPFNHTAKPRYMGKGTVFPLPYDFLINARRAYPYSKTEKSMLIFPSFYTVGAEAPHYKNSATRKICVSIKISTIVAEFKRRSAPCYLLPQVLQNQTAGAIFDFFILQRISRDFFLPIGVRILKQKI